MSVVAVHAKLSARAHRAPAPEVQPIEAIARWCECLQGKQPLLTGLRQVARALGARSVCLARHSRHAVRMAQTVSVSDPEIVASSDELERSFAHCVLGVYVDRPRAGSVWLSSLADEHNDPALAAFQKRTGIAETVVIPLSLEEKRIDYLELHFAEPPGPEFQEVLGTVGDALSRVWSARSPGLFHEAVLSSRKGQRVAVLRGQLLSTANPASLSRAEFRVCLLLSRGLNREGICDELSISSGTLRTHLRSIFRKAGVSSLSELVYMLLVPSTPPGEGLVRHLARPA